MTNVNDGYLGIMVDLRNDRFYKVENQRARFLTDVGQDFLGKYPIATFTMPDGSQYKAWRKPLSTKIETNKPFPFKIEYRTYGWYANLLEMIYQE